MDFRTDAGPACLRCGGTVYSYRVTDGPDRPEAQCCGLTVRCVGCHFTSWYEPGPGDAKPTTAAEARALHERLCAAWSACSTCNQPGRCDDGCPGWFRNEETGRIERCDTCKRFADDDEALAHVLACHLPEGGCKDCGVAPRELHAYDCPVIAGQMYIDGQLVPYEGED